MTLPTNEDVFNTLIDCKKCTLTYFHPIKEIIMTRIAAVAQWIKCWPCKRKVGCSNPSAYYQYQQYQRSQ